MRAHPVAKPAPAPVERLGTRLAWRRS